MIIFFFKGLGKKTLSVFEYGDSEDLHDSITEAFPQVTDAGGYELLRISEGTRRVLEVIPQPPSGYTAEYLKECVHQAKIYIRPMQRDLPDAALSSNVVMHAAVSNF